MRLGMMLAAGLVGAGLLVGCGASGQMPGSAAGRVEAVRGLEEKVAGLKVGMTRDEVVALLGKPKMVSEERNFLSFTQEGLLEKPVAPPKGLEGVMVDPEGYSRNKLHYKRADGSVLVLYFDDDWKYNPAYEWAC